MIVDVVSQGHRRTVALRAPRGPTSGPRCSRDSACGLIPQSQCCSSTALTSPRSTPQRLLQAKDCFASLSQRSLACSNGTALSDVEIIDSRCRGKRMKDGTSRWIGLDRARHDTRVLGSSIHPASPPLPAPALATILCAFAFTMEESPN